MRRGLLLPSAKDNRISFWSAHRYVRSQGCTSAYNGVTFVAYRNKWRSQNYSQHLRYFGKKVGAAHAYDAALPGSSMTLQRKLDWLNFRTPQELEAWNAHQQLPLDPYLNDNGFHQSFAKEAAGIKFIEEKLSSGNSKNGFELRKIGEHARADIIARPRNSTIGDAWIGVQVKTTWTKGKYAYAFRLNSVNYAGMLVICIALADQLAWALCGNDLPLQTLTITPGGKWDSWQCLDMSRAFENAWGQSELFKRLSLMEFENQCSQSHYKERQSQIWGQRLFSACGFLVQRPSVSGSTVDMIVNGDRIQDKTVRRRNAQDRFCVSCKKRQHGSNGPYEHLDFDKLIVYIWLREALACFYIFPMSELIHQGVVSCPGISKGRTNLALHPPWAPPRHLSTWSRHAWQMRYYINLRDSASHDHQISAATIDQISKHFA